MLPDTQLSLHASQLAQNEIPSYLQDKGETGYPSELITKLSSLGFWGCNIKKEFGGLELERGEQLSIVCQLSSGWQSLTALLGTHFRTALYLQQCGTPEQQREYLPKLAKGEWIGSHAYHEIGTKTHSEFKTELRQKENALVLSGQKNWVTNAKDAAFFIVIARNNSQHLEGQLSAVLVDPNASGVVIEDELDRPGINGVSLCPVSFNDCQIQSSQLIGGRAADIEGFIQRFRYGSSLAFSARALGSVVAIQRILSRRNLLNRSGSQANSVMNFRRGQIDTLAYSMEATLCHSLSLDSVSREAYMTKVHCTEALQQIVRLSMMISGGSGYASTDGGLARIFRDAASLPLIDTPNDTLTSRIGESSN